MGCFPGEFQEGKWPIKAFRENGPLRRENGPLRSGKRPINANGQFSGTPCQGGKRPLEEGPLRVRTARRIGANPEKSDLVNFWGPG